MESKIRAKLKAMNYQLYQEATVEFDQTRQQAWPGWKRVIITLRQRLKSPWQILDLGCGNGRFLKFLLDQKLKPETYLGLDFSANLVKLAKQRYGQVGTIDFLVTDLDSISQQKRLLELKRQFNLVVAFGVFHHLPGDSERRQWCLYLKDWVKPGGFLVISFWLGQGQCALKQRRAKQRQLKASGIAQADLELGDLILPFGQTRHWRYCHWFSREEARRLTNDQDWQLVAEFTADGQSQQANWYRVLRRQAG